MSPIHPIRVEVGKAGQRYEYPSEKHLVYRKEESPALPLTQVSYFPGLAVGFCTGRCLHPLIICASFDVVDAGCNVAIAVAWFAALSGILGAVLLVRSARSSTIALAWHLRFFRKQLSHGYLEAVALCTLALAVCLDLLHQVVALARYDYFWGTGFVKSADDTPPASQDEPVAYILILIHAVGLLGMVLLVCTHTRCFLAAWAQLAAQAKVGALSGESSMPEDLETGDRHRSGVAEGLNAGRARTSSQDRSARPPRAPGGPRAAGSVDGTPPQDGVPLGTPRRDESRAWMWNSKKWVRVRILRSLTDAHVVVRVEGGEVVHTRQSLLRKRQPGDEPPSPLHKPQSQQRPASADAGSRGRSRAHEAGDRPASEGSARRRRSAPASQDREEQFDDDEDSDCPRWARERLVRLREELKALAPLEPQERRKQLRALQRELHPDKQPAELREYANPLFLIVQKEWEIEEALAKQAAVSEGGG